MQKPSTPQASILSKCIHNSFSDHGDSPNDSNRDNSDIHTANVNVNVNDTNNTDVDNDDTDNNVRAALH